MKTEILVIGRHEEILQILIRLINQNVEWNATATSSDEEAKQLFAGGVFDIVLLSSGIEKQSEELLRNYFMEQRPGIIIIQHYGGGSGLLTGEILMALEQRDSQQYPA